MDTPLRRRRREMGLTQEELAQRCHLYRNTISRYEQGRVTPSKQVLETLMRVTGLSADALLFPDHYLERHPDFLIDFAEQPRRGRPPQSPAS